MSPVPVGVVRPADHEPRDGAADLDLAGIELVDAGAALSVDERDGDAVRARRHAQPRAPPLVELDGCAVEGELDARAVAVHEPPRRVVPAGRRQRGLHGQLVLGVERKIVLDGETAARAERQAFDVPLLRRAAGSRVARLAVAHRAVADGAPADLHRRERIAFEQGRRHAERGGDVVEAVGRGVRRQCARNRARVEREQILNRVGVLRAVQTCERLRAGVRCARGG